jgi:hypothetical protein
MVTVPASSSGARRHEQVLKRLKHKPPVIRQSYSSKAGTAILICVTAQPYRTLQTPTISAHIYYSP